MLFMHFTWEFWFETMTVCQSAFFFVGCIFFVSCYSVLTAVERVEMRGRNGIRGRSPSSRGRYGGRGRASDLPSSLLTFVTLQVIYLFCFDCLKFINFLKHLDSIKQGMNLE